MLFVFVSFGLSENAFGQVQVKGNVKDSNGVPLPGATVTVKENETVGTQTDFDGNYSIEVSDGTAILVFRYLGYVSQEVTVGDQRVIDVMMQEDVSGLEEIVLIGYGSQKRSDVTGAVSTLKSEDLNQVVTTNATDALQGRIAGVTVTSSSGSPGSVADVLIRGIGSFGNNRPLFIVDGVQADPYFNDSRNIESIEVLKDAASAAIYGTRAANGVVIITTKKGKEGVVKVDFETSYSSNTSRETLDLLDANGYVQVHQQMYENAGATLPNYVTSPPNVNTDWIDETHRDGDLTLMNLRVSGGSETVNYSVGGNYADETGLLIGSSFSKKGIYSNIGINKGKLKINTNLNYSETRREGYKFSLRETYQISPLIPVYDDTKDSGFGYRDGDLPDHRNPVGEDFYENGYTRLKYFLGSVDLNYEIIEGLNVNANFACAEASPM